MSQLKNKLRLCGKLMRLCTREIIFIGIVGIFLSSCQMASHQKVQPPALQHKTFAPVRRTSRPYCINGAWYVPQTYYEYQEIGVASYYGRGDGFHGKKTATGRRFDGNALTAAHKTLPIPCVAMITNLENGRSVQVVVCDRGPFKGRRLVDVSYGAAKALGFVHQGRALIKIRVLTDKSMRLTENISHYAGRGRPRRPV